MLETSAFRWMLDNVFVLPVADQYLVYAPLGDLAALVDGLAVDRLREGLSAGQSAGQGPLDEIVRTLRLGAGRAPLPRRGPLAPAFLGLIPTRGCNLACGYCGFLTGGDADRTMDRGLAREAVLWYLDLAAQAAQPAAEVHFFGGEPFCAEQVVDFVYHLARLRAAERGIALRFEAATNGIFGEDRARWVADSFDSVILSLDGPAAIQNRQRPRRDGRGSFAAVARSAAILSEGAVELSFRACVTADTVAQMPQTAEWFCREYRPVSVCFEPVQPTAESDAAGLLPPEPWAFAFNFVQAARILEAFGVEPVYAAADIRTRQATLCPVGRDAPIVSPDGEISACYLLRRDWEARGLDLRLGKIADGQVELDAGAVESVRRLSVWNKPFCADCFCRWHCAGGCHVNHDLPATPGDFSRLCIQTRLITVRNILAAMGRDDLAQSLFEQPALLERAVWQASDSIESVEVRG